MRIFYLVLILILSNYCKIASQAQICDTTSYFAYLLERNTVSPKIDCDAYIISKFSFERFQYLNNEYRNTLGEYSQLDSLFSAVINGFTENTNELKRIYEAQRIEIVNMSSTVLPQLDSTLLDLGVAKNSMIEATNSMNDALGSIRKAKKEKWIYAGIGFLIGGLTLAVLNE